MTSPSETDAEHGVLESGRLYRLGRVCARRAWWVIGAWLLVAVLVMVGRAAFGGSYLDDFNLPGTQSQAGADLIAAHDPAVGANTGQVVFSVSSGSVADQRSVIESATTAIGKVPHVVSVSDPLAAATTSKDGTTAYATVHFDQNPLKLGKPTVDRIDAAVAPARAAGVQVDYGGPLGQAAKPDASEIAEVVGILAAIVILLVGFGSVYAAGLPILSAVTGVVTGLGILSLLAAATTFASVSPTLALMMGLGVGIDYALFLTTRHRQMLMDGHDPVEAAAHTVATSGRAVVTAAVTVMLAMFGLYASGLAFIGKLGLAAATTVGVGAVAAVTLVPALLGAAGRRIDRLHVRTPVAERSAGSGESGWHRYAERVGAHPWRFLISGLAVLAILIIPFFSMRLGHVDAGADPSGWTSRRAYDLIEKGFGIGANGPLTVVVDVPKGATADAATQLGQQVATAIAASDDVASVSPAQPSSDGSLLILSVVPKTGPQDAATLTLLDTLRAQTLPKALAGSQARGLVTGPVASQLDFRNKIADRLPLIVIVVIVLAFLLLLATFRSPVLALKAAVLNLVSIGAAYGVLVAVYQWGWGSSLLGVGEKVPIESYVPMMMFAIVFGLSMDYEVFLLSRIREGWLRHHDNHASIVEGLSATARVITCAALIMASVFFSFVANPSVVVKMIALGLGVSVIVDATVIRLLLVPASMYLLDRLNWWMPAWLDRWLPHLDPEGPPPETHVAAVPAGDA
ncbi:MMPL family transporter [Nocardioides sp. Iso805N]|uniref:MMPL family transporter n=1 Tax=Nocardioides sp. Iso805N TaxID=1283287 RepID=UPI0003681F99|nr:MMPL family transporter [Nocardioides sp. Iso805N]